MCPRWDWARLNPLAVLRKRFAAARLVFNLGITTPSPSGALSSFSPWGTEVPWGGTTAVAVAHFLCRALSPTCSSGLLLLRPEHHHHLPPFHQRVLLDLRIRRQICRHPLQELAADFLMCHFAATEPHGHLGLVAFLQEADQVAQLHLIVALFRSGAKLHFLDLNLLLRAPSCSARTGICRSP